MPKNPFWQRYTTYLKSKKWKALRTRILKQRGRKCERCGKGGTVQLHHLTYKNVFKERDEDLLLVCRPCHRKIHGRKF